MNFMAFCIDFKLLRMDDTKALYLYGDCSENFEGLFELDLEKLLSGETSFNTDMREVVKVINRVLVTQNISIKQIEHLAKFTNTIKRQKSTY